MATTSNNHRRVLLGFILTATIGFFALAGLARDAQAANLPAPSVLSGPAEGSTIGTDSTQFVFQYLDPITGGTLAGFLCSVDGAPDVACNGVFDIAGLSAGLHTVGVKGTINLLGGEPVCVLLVCIDPGPVSVDTDALTRTFIVELPPGPNGSNGANGANGVNGTTAGSNAAFLAAWTKYKKQRAQCTRMKKRIKRYKTHVNRMHAAKRHKTCLKRQNKLRRAALAIAK